MILDDISTLEWIGYPTPDLLRFVHALSATCRKVQPNFVTVLGLIYVEIAPYQTNTSLLIRHHVLTPGEPDDILRLLHQLGAYHLEVLPLSTGRSGSVSGQVNRARARISPKCLTIYKFRSRCIRDQVLQTRFIELSLGSLPYSTV